VNATSLANAISVASRIFFLHIVTNTSEPQALFEIAEMKKILHLIYKPVRDYFIKHPALLSGYIIYAYLLFTTMDFYTNFKKTHTVGLLSTLEKFDAVIWMWLLAVVLVKVIEYRHRLNQQERQRLEQEKALEVKGAQLSTTHQMIRTLQHQINNPLTIILLYVQRALRRAENNQQDLENLIMVKNGAERIATTLREFAQAQGVETVDSPVGNLVSPSKKDDAKRTVDEARPA
jgi:signal transduction histidine kinase